MRSLQLVLRLTCASERVQQVEAVFGAFHPLDACFRGHAREVATTIWVAGVFCQGQVVRAIDSTQSR